MITIKHYLYILSSWAYIAEPALAKAQQVYGDCIKYEWHLACADYDGAGPYKRHELEYYYKRLESATGLSLNLDWWYEGCDAHNADLIAEAARSLGATGNSVRLALASAALEKGIQVTRMDVGVPIAAGAARLSESDLFKAVADPKIKERLSGSKQEYLALGVSQRPVFCLSNEIGDTVLLSGLWRAEPLLSALDELIKDEKSQNAFPAGP